MTGRDGASSALCGVVYVVFGDKYEAEAKKSIRSLRSTGSPLAVAVITNLPWDEEPQPNHFVIRAANHLFASRPEYAYEGSPFEHTLLVDADTYFCRRPDRVFGLLDHYELGGLFAGPQLRNEDEGLYFHPKLNGGVLLYKKHPKVEVLFRLWRESCRKQAGAESPAQGWIAPDDQRLLTLAVVRSGVRHVHLGDWMNFVLWRTTTTMSPPVILHGRDRNMAWVANELSGRWDEDHDWRQRVWIPHVMGLLPGGGIGWYDPLLRAWSLLRRVWNRLRRRRFR